MSESESTVLEKATVCGTSFACSCAAFFFSVVMLIPLLGTAMEALRLHDVLQQGVLLFALFGIPILGALWGIHIGASLVLAKRAESGA